jgi:hypothetical protein
LPGTEELNVQKSLDTLNAWSQVVKLETAKNLHHYTEQPELFCHSLAYYRMQMLGDSLVHDLGMRYNPVRAEESRKGLDTPEAVSKFFHNSKDIFLFGLLNGDHSGRRNFPSGLAAPIEQSGNCGSFLAVPLGVSRQFGTIRRGITVLGYCGQVSARHAGME